MSQFDLGRAERVYYTPREHAEWEHEDTVTVYCSNEECADFDVARDEEVVFSMSDLYGYAEWTCPTCQTVQSAEKEYSDDYFIDPDAGRD